MALAVSLVICCLPVASRETVDALSPAAAPIWRWLLAHVRLNQGARPLLSLVVIRFRGLSDSRMT
jgi:hypothetical protein